MEERLILVDSRDNPMGHAPKMAVHRRGLLHRAFSIFIFDGRGRLLLQRRALGKYHSQGLWTNTCCGHPRRGETTEGAAKRRLNEEMGIDCDVLVEVHAFVYREQVSNQLIEHEYDHVLVGLSHTDPVANPEEALDWKWQTLDDLERDISVAPDLFTVWFRKILQHQGVERIGAWKDRLIGSDGGVTYSLLNTMHLPSDLRALHQQSLFQLASELRAFILQSVASTGGHLAANLGTVELSIALHYVFDTPSDRVVWDVGHQSYAHKVLTGRRDAMTHIRQLGGISGFPRRQESEFDPFGTAHSSTSVSAALGMAIASFYKGEHRYCVAVIGDGALSGGMAFEAMNHAGTYQDLPLLVILNDNDMSISAPVGALRAHLKGLVCGSGPTNVPSFFQALGFDYSGPVDGHSLDELIAALMALKRRTGPQLLHIVTEKGHGYGPAVLDPVLYHGPGKFDLLQGVKASASTSLTYAQVVALWLCEEAELDPRVMAITPAMCEGSGLVAFQKRFPDRCFDVAIAEQHALTFAAGLAVEGLKPVVVIYSTFLQRGYDQLIHDIAIQRLAVVFAIDRAGIVGADGATHMGAFDIAFLRCIPGLVLMAPADENECRQMLHTALLQNGPAAVRFPRGSGSGASINMPLKGLPLGRGEIRRLASRQKAPKVAILAFGSMLTPCLEAALELDATVANMRFIKPLDDELVNRLARSHDVLVTVEEGCIKGGAGSACLEYLITAGLSRPTLQLGFGDQFIEHGSPEELLRACGLDATGIVVSISRFLDSSFLGHNDAFA